MRAPFRILLVVAISTAWWLVVPLSIGFGLRWMLTGYTSAAGSVFNPADPSVYLLWLRVGVTTGVFFAFDFVRDFEASRKLAHSRLRRRGYGTAMFMGIVAAMSAPFFFQ